MRIFDFHAHYYPDHIAANVIKSLEKPRFAAFLDGTRASLERRMREVGIEAALNLPVATMPEQVEGINRRMAADNHAPVYCLGSMHPDYPEPGPMLKTLAANGLKGIKMHPEYQAFNPLEKRCDKIWEACSEHGVFVHFHAGDDVAFEPPFSSSPKVFHELKRRYPALRLVLAHMGSLNMWDDVERLLVGGDYYFDTGYSFEFISNEQFLRIIRSHGADKVLFGSDTPWRCLRTTIDLAMGAGLTDEEKRLFFFDNAARLLGLKA